MEFGEVLMNPWFRPKSKPEGVKLRPKRREPRYSVPVLSVRIMAELITSTRSYHGMLWDISTRGACVQSYEPIPSGISCTLRLHQHAGSQVIARHARLLWRDDVMRAYYVGMSFDEPIPVDSSTFLGTLILNSRAFQDGVE
jgi:hypothetical protein